MTPERYDRDAIEEEEERDSSAGNGFDRNVSVWGSVVISKGSISEQ